MKGLYRLIFVAVFVEVIICNFRTWESMGWTSYDMVENDSFLLKDGQFVTTEADKSSVVAPFREDGWCDVTAFDGMYPVKNIYLLCRYLDSDSQPIENSYVTVYMKVRDEGNAISYQLPDRVVAPEIRRTQYNRLNPCGQLKGLELTFLKPDYRDIAAVEIVACQFNVHVPFRFSLLRCCIVLLLILSVYYLRPGSRIYQRAVDEKFRGKKTVVIICLMGCILFSLFFANINPQYYYKNYRTQYHDLAEAFMEGNPYLNEKPANSLATMENPYDTNLREAVTREAGETWRLDWAYFNNRYYVYFGVVPVLMHFLPYYALTGTHLSVNASVSFFGIFYIAGCFALLWMIFKRKFSKAPFALYLLGCGMLVFCSGMFYAFRGPAFYGLPILAAAAFSVWGLWFWYGSREEGQYPVSCRKVMCGSLCIAMTAGCRPQFLIVSAVSIFIFYDCLSDKNFVFSKQGRKFLAAWVVPALVVASGIMYYNFIRFGSPMDFGANYNLTSNDMTHREWHWDRTILGIYMYLFEPTKISAVFPFILDSLMPADCVIPFTNYMGITIFEGNFGGIVFNHPVLALPFLALPLRKYCKKDVYRTSLFFMASAVVIIVADTQMAGLVGRYLMDFGWLLCLASVLLVSSVEERCGDNTFKMLIRSAVLISVLWGVIYEFLLAFNAHTNSSLRAFCPSLYYRVQSAVAFWL